MTTVWGKNVRRDVCQDCGHDRGQHSAFYGECATKGCTCESFFSAPPMVWSGSLSSIAYDIDSIPGLPPFFLFEDARAMTVHVFFDAPVDHDVWLRCRSVDSKPVGVVIHVWCRTGEVPEDLRDMAEQARTDDTTAAVFLDALIERGLAREANA